MLGGIVVLAAIFAATCGIAAWIARGDSRADAAPGAADAAGWPRRVGRRDDRRDGPILFPGLNTTTGERTLILDHQGDDPTRGWRVYLAYPADGDPTCAVTQVRRTDRFTDCTGTSSTSPTSPGRPTPVRSSRTANASRSAWSPTSAVADWRRRSSSDITAQIGAASAASEAGAELLAVRLQLAAVQRQPADDVGAGGLHGAGETVEALARVEGERAEHGRPLAPHRRQVGDLRRRPRRLTDDEQAVHPRADEDDVGVLDRRVVGLPDRRQRA